MTASEHHEPFVRSAGEGVSGPQGYRAQSRGAPRRVGRGRSGSPGAAVAGPGAVRGAEPAVRPVPAPPWAAGASSIARFLVFSLSLTEKTNKQTKKPLC